MVHGPSGREDGVYQLCVEDVTDRLRAPPRPASPTEGNHANRSSPPGHTRSRRGVTATSRLVP